MLKKYMLATFSSVFLLLSVAVHAGPVSVVYSCKLKEGSTKPDIATWGKVVDADSEFDDEFGEISTCSNSRMYRGEETMPAK